MPPPSLLLSYQFMDQGCRAVLSVVSFVSKHNFITTQSNAFHTGNKYGMYFLFCIIQCIMHHTQSSCIRSWHSAGRSCLLPASRRTLMQLENHQNQKMQKKKLNAHRKIEHGWVVEELHCMQQNRTLLFPVLQWGVSYQDGRLEQATREYRWQN